MRTSPPRLRNTGFNSNVCVKLTFMVLSGRWTLLLFLIFNPLAQLLCQDGITQLKSLFRNSQSEESGSEQDLNQRL